MKNLIKAENIIAIVILLNRLLIKRKTVISAILEKIIKGIIVAIGAGRSPLISAIDEGKIATIAALARGNF